MKKIISSFFLIIVATTSTYAQGLFDAARNNDESIVGTARYMGMSGALGALGADASALLDNPAALGVYKNSETTLTINFNPTNTQTTWNGSSGTDNRFALQLNHAAFVWALNTGRDQGYTTSNFSFTFNRRRHFNRGLNFYGKGFDNSIADHIALMTNGLHYNDLRSGNAYKNENIGWLSILGFDAGLITPIGDSTQWHSCLALGDLTDKAYASFENGGINEFNFGYGFNISRRFHFGLSFSLLTMTYNLQSQYEESDQVNGNFYLRNYFVSNGQGWNVKFGFIAHPVPPVSIGLAFHTPTYYTMEDKFHAEARARANANELRTEIGSSNYRYKAPLKLQVSLGFFIHERAVIDIDYQFSNSRKGMGLYNNQVIDFSHGFDIDNNDIRHNCLPIHLVKVGSEIMLIEKTLPLRIGVAYRSPSMKETAMRNDPLNTIRTDAVYFVDRGSVFASAGLGYRYKGFSGDLAYQLQYKSEQFHPYTWIDNSHYADVHTLYHNIALSVSYRF